MGMKVEKVCKLILTQRIHASTHIIFLNVYDIVIRTFRVFGYLILIHENMHNVIKEDDDEDDNAKLVVTVAELIIIMLLI